MPCFKQITLTFLLLQRKRLFSTFVTPDFKKRQNRNETSLKNETKFIGIFASLVIKLETPLVLKVQTRATPEQRMMPIKTAMRYNQKQKRDLKYLHHIKHKLIMEKKLFHINSFMTEVPIIYKYWFLYDWNLRHERV